MAQKFGLAQNILGPVKGQGIIDLTYWIGECHSLLIIQLGTAKAQEWVMSFTKQNNNKKHVIFVKDHTQQKNSTKKRPKILWCQIVF